MIYGFWCTDVAVNFASLGFKWTDYLLNSALNKFCYYETTVHGLLWRLTVQGYASDREFVTTAGENPSAQKTSYDAVPQLAKSFAD